MYTNQIKEVNMHQIRKQFFPLFILIFIFLSVSGTSAASLSDKMILTLSEPLQAELKDAIRLY